MLNAECKMLKSSEVSLSDNVWYLYFYVKF